MFAVDAAMVAGRFGPGNWESSLIKRGRFLVWWGTVFEAPFFSERHDRGCRVLCKS